LQEPNPLKIEIITRDDPRALELIRHDARMCWPKRCSRCGPARR
jgi:hypothetical protein